MPKKQQMRKSRRSAPRHFQTGAHPATTLAVPRVVRCPKFPPQMTYGPPVRRTIQLQGTLAAGGSRTILSEDIFREDSAEYLGVLTTQPFRFQGMNVVGCRLWLFSSSVEPPALDVAVNSLDDSDSNPSVSQSVFILRDIGSVSDPACVAWMWQNTAQGLNIVSYTGRNLFTVFNQSTVGNARYVFQLEFIGTP